MSLYGFYIFNITILIVIYGFMLYFTFIYEKSYIYIELSHFYHHFG